MFNDRNVERLVGNAVAIACTIGGRKQEEEVRIKAVLNRALNEDDKITIANMDDNSNIVAYLAATANDPQNGKFIEVKPGKKVQVKAIELGDINNTFLIIRNISPVNDGSYRVEVPLEL